MVVLIIKKSENRCRQSRPSWPWTESIYDWNTLNFFVRSFNELFLEITMCHLWTWVYCLNSFSSFIELCHFNQFVGVVSHCTVMVVVFGWGSSLNAWARVLYYCPSMNELTQPTNRLHWRSLLQPQENKLRFSNVWPYQTCLSQLFRYVGYFKAQGYSQKSWVVLKTLTLPITEICEFSVLLCFFTWPKTRFPVCDRRGWYSCTKRKVWRTFVDGLVGVPSLLVFHRNCNRADRWCFQNI